MSFHSRTKRGFTLMELMVSIGIMAMISVLIVGNQSDYTSGASLKNVANDLSLSLRQAQVYGISVKELTIGSETSFTSGYGMAFNIAESPTGDDKSFIFFADRNPLNGQYDGNWSCDNECLDKTTLLSGNRVSRLCVLPQGGGESCDVTDLEISFLRPAIEARIYYNGGSTGVSGAKIELSSPDGNKNTVTVYTTGQISVSVQ